MKICNFVKFFALTCIFGINNNFAVELPIKQEKQINTIIIDLGGVAFDQVGKFAIPWLIYHIGIRNILNYCFDNKRFSGKEIFSRIFEFGNYLYGIDNCEHQWYASEISGNDLEKKISENIDREESFFFNKSEKEVIRYCSDLFIPSNVAFLISLNNQAFEVAKELKESGYQLFILSNWDTQSFELIKRRYPIFFALFDEDKIIISGDTRKKIGTPLTKPDTRFFDYILKLTNQNPKNCLFIDDNGVNTETAKKMGMNSITHKNWDTTRNELVELKLIKQTNWFNQYQYKIAIACAIAIAAWKLSRKFI